jgi:hypothetical protein
MADTLRGVLAVVDADEPYPWGGGALKQQLREDITAFELLGLDDLAQRPGEAGGEQQDGERLTVDFTELRKHWRLGDGS